MKFLTDENIAYSVVKALRASGFDVKDVKEERLYGAPDKELLKIALAEERIILTHDKDFANLSSHKKGDMPGVILLRFKQQNPKLIVHILLSLFQSNVQKKFAGNLVVISENNIMIQKSK